MPKTESELIQVCQSQGVVFEQIEGARGWFPVRRDGMVGVSFSSGVEWYARSEITEGTLPYAGFATKEIAAIDLIEHAVSQVHNEQAKGD